MLTREEIGRIVNRANHEAGFLRFFDDVVVQLVERLRRGESIASLDASEIDDDDLQMALDLVRMERF